MSSRHSHIMSRQIWRFVILFAAGACPQSCDRPSPHSIQIKATPNRTDVINKWVSPLSGQRPLPELLELASNWLDVLRDPCVGQGVEQEGSVEVGSFAFAVEEGWAVQKDLDDGTSVSHRLQIRDHSYIEIHGPNEEPTWVLAQFGIMSSQFQHPLEAEAARVLFQSLMDRSELLALLQQFGEPARQEILSGEASPAAISNWIAAVALLQSTFSPFFDNACTGDEFIGYHATYPSGDASGGSFFFIAIHPRDERESAVITILGKDVGGEGVPVTSTCWLCDRLVVHGNDD